MKQVSDQLHLVCRILGSITVGATNFFQSLWGICYVLVEKWINFCLSLDKKRSGEQTGAPYWLHPKFQSFPYCKTNYKINMYRQ